MYRLLHACMLVLGGDIVSSLNHDSSSSPSRSSRHEFSLFILVNWSGYYRITHSQQSGTELLAKRQLSNHIPANRVTLAIFAKFLSNVPLPGQKSHFFKDFVPLSGFDRLAGMCTFWRSGTEGWRGLSCSCRPTGLHGTIRLSVIVCLDLYQWSSRSIMLWLY